jgi:hypothetical protein
MKGIICYGFNLVALAWLAVVPVAAQPPSTPPPAANQSAPIPMDQLGTVAGKQYHGEGLSITATPDGARLRSAFQRLEGVVTSEGLWLHSTAGDAHGEPFRVMAVDVGRKEEFGVRRQSAAATPRFRGEWMQMATADFESGVALCFPPQSMTLPVRGAVSVNGQTVRFGRPGLTEEYSVNVDGVRQDFIVEHRPEGDGELRVELDVTGAEVEPQVNGVLLVLDGFGRKIAYDRLRVSDARGQKLTARLEVTDSTRLRVVVEDAVAVYPVRIDPTFSDADWSNLGGIPGINRFVRAAVLDEIGNLYIGGDFTMIGEVTANRIAKWDGSAWSALGSGIMGINNVVYALAVSGTNLYAAGAFTNAGGIMANHIAKWDGTVWSALDSGMNDEIFALAASGTNLYAGGSFYTASGNPASRIAKWDGNSWSSLGLGLDNNVSTLVISDTGLYAGGSFTTAGGNPARRVAKWNGSAWSALGSGMNDYVLALAVSGTDLYAGGWFLDAGGNSANRIAKWDGKAWSALGSGMKWMNSSIAWVESLAVSGANLYAGGYFTTAGGTEASYIAEWNGSAWSALGSGMDSQVRALAVSGTNLYVGGDFSTAGGKVSAYLAKANISAAPGQFGNLAYSPATGFSCTFLDASVGQPYRVQTSPSLAVGPWTDLTNFIYASPIVISDAAAILATNTFYRAVTP